MKTSTISHSRKVREATVLNTLCRAYGVGSLSIRQLSTVTGYAEPRISETVTHLEATGDVRTARRGKVRLVELSKHPSHYHKRNA